MKLRALPAGLLLLVLAATAGASDDDASVARLIAAGDLTRAEEVLRGHLAGGDDPHARDLLGVVLGRQGRLDEAEEQFVRAVAADPTFRDARQHLARLHLLRQRDEDALEQLRAAAELGPIERDLAMKLAILEISAGNEAAAETQLRQLAERFDSVQARLYLARLQTGRGDGEGAMTTLRAALEVAPSSEEVLRAHARTALESDEPVAAILALEPLTRMHPKSVEYPYLMGVARLQIGDWAGASEAFEKARVVEPQRPLTLLGLGLAYNGQKRFDEARQALVESLRLEPDNVEALAGLAEAEEGLSQLESAERYASRALARDSSHAGANLVLGMIRMKQGRYAEARQALERAVTGDAGSPKALYQLSQACARLGDREGAERHLTLYRQALRTFEDRLRELDEGSPGGGSSP